MHAPHSNLLSCFRYQFQPGCVTSIIGSCIWFRLELMVFLSISETSRVVRMYVVQYNNLLSCFRYRLQPGCLISILIPVHYVGYLGVNFFISKTGLWKMTIFIDASGVTQIQTLVCMSHAITCSSISDTDCSQDVSPPSWYMSIIEAMSTGLFFHFRQFTCCQDVCCGMQ